MLNAARPLSQSLLHSTIEGQSRLRPKGGGRFRRSTVASLMLTSLVDAFSILVIFLIMSHSTSQDVVDMGKVKLPQASESEFIQTGVAVRIENGRFMVDQKSIELSQLAAELKAINQKNASASSSEKKDGIVIVADKEMSYESLSPVILAGSAAGFTKFKFAVIRKD